MVVFEMKKFSPEDGSLLDLSPDEEGSIRRVPEGPLPAVRNGFNFFLSDEITLPKKIRFSNLGAEKLLKIISDPEYSKPRFSKVKDAALLAQLRTDSVAGCGPALRDSRQCGGEVLGDGRPYRAASS